MLQFRCAISLVLFTAFLLGGCQSLASQQHQWTSAQGGIIVDPRQDRVATLCASLTAGTIRTPVRIHVLNSTAPAAYSWSCGDIYVSAGLIDLLPDDQLRA